MIDEKLLEKDYRERLEENLIAFLAEQNALTYEEAMELYYGSRLADKIGEGRFGVQYLDIKVLAELLKETEPELFAGGEKGAAHDH